MMQLLVDGHNVLGECVLWCERTGRVLWTDIESSVLYAHTPASGETRDWKMPERLCCFALTESADRLLVGLASGPGFFEFSTGQVTRICEVEADMLRTRLNDGRCDRQGRFVFGTLNEESNPKSPVGSYYRLNHDLTLERLPLGGVAIANSICFSPDGRTMYYADSATRAILRCDYDPGTGAVGGQRVFVPADAAPGDPDGSAIDADGCLWSTRWGAGQVIRFTPDGRIERVIGLAAPQPSCPAFGGEQFNVLYVSSARVGLSDAQVDAAPLSGGLFQQALDVRGLPESRFCSRAR